MSSLLLVRTPRPHSMCHPRPYKHLAVSRESVGRLMVLDKLALKMLCSEPAPYAGVRPRCCDRLDLANNWRTKAGHKARESGVVD
jgi:hypothetical protein